MRGIPGWRGPVADPDTTLTLTSDVWEYAPDAWALVTDRSGLTEGGATAAEELAVAQAVRVTDPPAALPVPLRLTWLPTGLQAGVVQTTTSGDPAGWLGFTADPADVADGDLLTVGVDAAAVAPDGPADVEVDGHPGWLMPGRTGIVTDTSPPSPRVLVVDYGGVFVSFTAAGSPGDRPDDATLVRIAAAAQPVATVTDVGSWIPAADAVPR